MSCKKQYELRKPLLLGRQIRNSFIVQEELHDFDDDSIVFETSKIKNKG